MRTSLLAQRLARLSTTASLGEFAEAVRRVGLSLPDVAQYVHFSDASYHRETIFQSDQFQVLVISWKPGQSSPIHNHRGSMCCVQVMQGTAIETTYTMSHDGRFSCCCESQAVGDVFAGEDLDIHAVANLPKSTIGLVTLHVYRPALTRMELFEIAGDRLVPCS